MLKSFRIAFIIICFLPQVWMCAQEEQENVLQKLDSSLDLLRELCPSKLYLGQYYLYKSEILTEFGSIKEGLRNNEIAIYFLQLQLAEAYKTNAILNKRLQRVEQSRFNLDLASSLFQKLPNINLKSVLSSLRFSIFREEELFPRLKMAIGLRNYSESITSLEQLRKDTEKKKILDEKSIFPRFDFAEKEKEERLEIKRMKAEQVQKELERQIAKRIEIEYKRTQRRNKNDADLLEQTLTEFRQVQQLENLKEQKKKETDTSTIEEEIKKLESEISKSRKDSEEINQLKIFELIKPENLSKVFIEWGKYQQETAIQEAEESFTKAIFLEPTNSEAYYQRGKLRQSQSETQKAEEDYSDSIRVFTEQCGAFRDAYFYRGQVRLKNKRVSEAKSDFKKYLDLAQNLVSSEIWEKRDYIFEVFPELNE